MPNQVQATNYAAAVEYAKQAALSLDQGDQDEYAKTLGKLAGAIPDLKGRQRATLLGQTDPRVLEALKETDELKKDARLIQALDRALGQQDSRHLGNAAEAKQDAQTVQATRWGSSQAEMVAQLRGQLDTINAAGHMRRPKKAEAKEIDAARQDPNKENAVLYQRLVAFLEDVSGAGEHEGLVNARAELAKANEVLKNKRAGSTKRAAARKSKATAQKTIESFEEVQARAGFILGEPEGREFLAHLCGLPSRLSKAQKAAAGSLDRDALLASLGSADAVPRQLAEKMIEARAGDPAALHRVEQMAANLSGLAAPPDPPGSSSHAAPPNAPGSSSHAAPPDPPGSSSHAAPPNAPSSSRHATATQASGHTTALAPGLQGMSPTVQNKLAQLQHANPQAYNMISDHLVGQQRSKANAERCYHEIMGLINSGMPIEAVIVFVMILLAERQEEKFNDKVKELTAYEQIDKMNAAAKEQIETLKHAAKLDPATLSQEINGRTSRIDQLKAAGGNGSLAEIGKLEDELSLLQKYGTSLDVGRDIADIEKSLVEPTDFGLKQKSSTIVMQELQAEMQIYMQVMQALAGVLRQIQDLVMTPVHNIR